MLAYATTDHEQGLVRVLPDVERVEDLWLVAHEDLRKSARVRAAYDFLIESMLKDHNHFRYGAVSQYPHPHFTMEPDTHEDLSVPTSTVA